MASARRWRAQNIARLTLAFDQRGLFQPAMFIADQLALAVRYRGTSQLAAPFADRTAKVDVQPRPRTDDHRQPRKHPPGPLAHCVPPRPRPLERIKIGDLQTTPCITAGYDPSDGRQAE